MNINVLNHLCGLLSDSVFVVSGEGSAKFLHGQLTASLNDMKAGDVRSALLLNPKGKIQAYTQVYYKFPDFWLVTPKAHAHALFNHLKMLAPLSKCQIRESDFQVYHACQLCGLETDEGQGSQRLKDEWSAIAQAQFSHSRFGSEGTDWIVSSENIPSESKIFDVRAGLRNAIERHFPLVTTNAILGAIPQECHLDHCLHFAKGCYLGQEVVARLEHRGQIKKELKSFRVRCCENENTDQSLELNQKELELIYQSGEEDNKSFLSPVAFYMQGFYWGQVMIPLHLDLTRFYYNGVQVEFLNRD